MGTQEVVPKAAGPVSERLSSTDMQAEPLSHTFEAPHRLSSFSPLSSRLHDISSAQLLTNVSSASCSARVSCCPSSPHAPQASSSASSPCSPHPSCRSLNPFSSFFDTSALSTRIHPLPVSDAPGRGEPTALVSEVLSSLQHHRLSHASFLHGSSRILNVLLSPHASSVTDDNASSHRNTTGFQRRDDLHARLQRGEDAATAFPQSLHPRSNCPYASLRHRESTGESSAGAAPPSPGASSIPSSFKSPSLIWRLLLSLAAARRRACIAPGGATGCRRCKHQGSTQFCCLSRLRTEGDCAMCEDRAQNCIGLCGGSYCWSCAAPSRVPEKEQPSDQWLWQLLLCSDEATLTYCHESNLPIEKAAPPPEDVEVNKAPEQNKKELRQAPPRYVLQTKVENSTYSSSSSSRPVQGYPCTRTSLSGVTGAGPMAVKPVSHLAKTAESETEYTGTRPAVAEMKNTFMPLSRRRTAASDDGDEVAEEAAAATAEPAARALAEKMAAVAGRREGSGQKQGDVVMWKMDSASSLEVSLSLHTRAGAEHPDSDLSIMPRSPAAAEKNVEGEFVLPEQLPRQSSCRTCETDDSSSSCTHNRDASKNSHSSTVNLDTSSKQAAGKQRNSWGNRETFREELDSNDKSRHKTPSLQEATKAHFPCNGCICCESYLLRVCRTFNTFFVRYFPLFTSDGVKGTDAYVCGNKPQIGEPVPVSAAASRLDGDSLSHSSCSSNFISLLRCPRCGDAEFPLASSCGPEAATAEFAATASMVVRPQNFLLPMLLHSSHLLQPATPSVQASISFPSSHCYLPSRLGECSRSHPGGAASSSSVGDTCVGHVCSASHTTAAANEATPSVLLAALHFFSLLLRSYPATAICLAPSLLQLLRAAAAALLASPASLFSQQTLVNPELNFPSVCTTKRGMKPRASSRLPLPRDCDSQISDVENMHAQSGCAPPSPSPPSNGAPVVPPPLAVAVPAAVPVPAVAAAAPGASAFTENPVETDLAKATLTLVRELLPLSVEVILSAAHAALTALRLHPREKISGSHSVTALPPAGDSASVFSCCLSALSKFPPAGGTTSFCCPASCSHLILPAKPYDTSCRCCCGEGEEGGKGVAISACGPAALSSPACQGEQHSEECLALDTEGLETELGAAAQWSSSNSSSCSSGIPCCVEQQQQTSSDFVSSCSTDEEVYLSGSIKWGDKADSSNVHSNSWKSTGKSNSVCKQHLLLLQQQNGIDGCCVAGGSSECAFPAAQSRQKQQPEESLLPQQAARQQQYQEQQLQHQEQQLGEQHPQEQRQHGQQQHGQQQQVQQQQVQQQQKQHQVERQGKVCMVSQQLHQDRDSNTETLRRALITGYPKEKERMRQTQEVEHVGANITSSSRLFQLDQLLLCAAITLDCSSNKRSINRSSGSSREGKKSSLWKPESDIIDRLRLSQPLQSFAARNKATATMHDVIAQEQHTQIESYRDWRYFLLQQQHLLHSQAYHLPAQEEALPAQLAERQQTHCEKLMLVRLLQSIIADARQQLLHAVGGTLLLLGRAKRENLERHPSLLNATWRLLLQLLLPAPRRVNLLPPEFSLSQHQPHLQQQQQPKKDMKDQQIPGARDTYCGQREMHMHMFVQQQHTQQMGADTCTSVVTHTTPEQQHGNNTSMNIAVEWLLAGLLQLAALHLGVLLSSVREISFSIAAAKEKPATDVNAAPVSGTERSKKLMAAATTTVGRDAGERIVIPTDSRYASLDNSHAHRSFFKITKAATEISSCKHSSEVPWHFNANHGNLREPDNPTQQLTSLGPLLSAAARAAMLFHFYATKGIHLFHGLPPPLRLWSERNISPCKCCCCCSSRERYQQHLLQQQQQESKQQESPSTNAVSVSTLSAFCRVNVDTITGAVKPAATAGSSAPAAIHPPSNMSKGSSISTTTSAAAIAAGDSDTRNPLHRCSSNSSKNESRHVKECQQQQQGDHVIGAASSLRENILLKKNDKQMQRSSAFSVDPMLVEQQLLLQQGQQQPLQRALHEWLCSLFLYQHGGYAAITAARDAARAAAAAGVEELLLQWRDLELLLHVMHAGRKQYVETPPHRQTRQPRQDYRQQQQHYGQQQRQHYGQQQQHQQHYGQQQHQQHYGQQQHQQHYGQQQQAEQQKTHRCGQAISTQQQGLSQHQVQHASQQSTSPQGHQQQGQQQQHVHQQQYVQQQQPHMQQQHHMQQQQHLQQQHHMQQQQLIQQQQMLERLIQQVCTRARGLVVLLAGRSSSHRDVATMEMIIRSNNDVPAHPYNSAAAACAADSAQKCGAESSSSSKCGSIRFSSSPLLPAASSQKFYEWLFLKAVCCSLPDFLMAAEEQQQQQQEQQQLCGSTSNMAAAAPTDHICVEYTSAAKISSADALAVCERENTDSQRVYQDRQNMYDSSSTDAASSSAASAFSSFAARVTSSSASAPSSSFGGTTSTFSAAGTSISSAAAVSPSRASSSSSWLPAPYAAARAATEAAIAVQQWVCKFPFQDMFHPHPLQQEAETQQLCKKQSVRTGRQQERQTQQETWQQQQHEWQRQLQERQIQQQAQMAQKQQQERQKQQQQQLLQRQVQQCERQQEHQERQQRHQDRGQQQQQQERVHHQQISAESLQRLQQQAQVLQEGKEKQFIDPQQDVESVKRKLLRQQQHQSSEHWEIYEKNEEWIEALLARWCIYATADLNILVSVQQQQQQARGGGSKNSSRGESREESISNISKQINKASSKDNTERDVCLQSRMLYRSKNDNKERYLSIQQRVLLLQRLFYWSSSSHPPLHTLALRIWQQISLGTCCCCSRGIDPSQSRSSSSSTSNGNSSSSSSTNNSSRFRRSDSIEQENSNSSNRICGRIYSTSTGVGIGRHNRYLQRARVDLLSCLYSLATRHISSNALSRHCSSSTEAQQQQQQQESPVSSRLLQQGQESAHRLTTQGKQQQQQHEEVDATSIYTSKQDDQQQETASRIYKYKQQQNFRQNTDKDILQRQHHLLLQQQEMIAPSSARLLDADKESSNKEEIRYNTAFNPISPTKYQGNTITSTRNEEKKITLVHELLLLPSREQQQLIKCLHVALRNAPFWLQQELLRQQILPFCESVLQHVQREFASLFARQPLSAAANDSTAHMPSPAEKASAAIAARQTHASLLSTSSQPKSNASLPPASSEASHVALSRDVHISDTSAAPDNLAACSVNIFYSPNKGGATVLMLLEVLRHLPSEALVGPCYEEQMTKKQHDYIQQLCSGASAPPAAVSCAESEGKRQNAFTSEHIQQQEKPAATGAAYISLTENKSSSSSNHMIDVDTREIMLCRSKTIPESSAAIRDRHSLLGSEIINIEREDETCGEMKRPRSNAFNIDNGRTATRRGRHEHQPSLLQCGNHSNTRVDRGAPNRYEDSSSRRFSPAGWKHRIEQKIHISKNIEKCIYDLLEELLQLAFACASGDAAMPGIPPRFEATRDLHCQKISLQSYFDIELVAVEIICRICCSCWDAPSPVAAAVQRHAAELCCFLRRYFSSPKIAAAADQVDAAAAALALIKAPYARGIVSTVERVSTLSDASHPSNATACASPAAVADAAAATADAANCAGIADPAVAAGDFAAESAAVVRYNHATDEAVGCGLLYAAALAVCCCWRSNSASGHLEPDQQQQNATEEVEAVEVVLLQTLREMLVARPHFISWSLLRALCFLEAAAASDHSGAAEALGLQKSPPDRSRAPATATSEAQSRHRVAGEKSPQNLSAPSASATSPAAGGRIIDDAALRMMRRLCCAIKEALRELGAEIPFAIARILWHCVIAVDTRYESVRAAAAAPEQLISKEAKALSSTNIGEDVQWYEAALQRGMLLVAPSWSGSDCRKRISKDKLHVPALTALAGAADCTIHLENRSLGATEEAFRKLLRTAAAVEPASTAAAVEIRGMMLLPLERTCVLL